MQEQKKYYVYRFKDKEDNVIYVGRTHDLNQRFKQHEHLTDSVTNIEYIECLSETDMVIKEIYYINLYANENSTNVKDVYDKPTDYGFNDKWKEYIKPEPIPKQPRKVRTVFNTPDFTKWSVIKLTMWYGDNETEAYVMHYDKDIKKLKYSTYLYEAELFSNKAAYFSAENFNEQKYIEEEKYEEAHPEAFDEYDMGGSYFSSETFESEYNNIQKMIFEKYLKENNIILEQN
jgi:predicted GIY-YIG superfamily endonuclease